MSAIAKSEADDQGVLTMKQTYRDEEVMDRKFLEDKLEREFA